ncbi:MAG TPA: DUF1932 domain-containing protein [Sphingomonas sp.]|nr:DUF1932 domain-containing protein [Sphingomonas sp.]
MHGAVAFIGFGEAGMALACPGARAYDRKTDDPATCAAKRADYLAAGVTGCTSAAEAISGAGTILSLVTADQSLAAALNAAPSLASGAFWLDLNSVAPDTKRATARVIEAVGGRYVDVAVMTPVQPRRHRVPLLVSGPHVEAAAATLRSIGFRDVRRVSAAIGGASAIKMIRSIMVKGIEALTAECMLAAEAADVRDEVLASLDAGEESKPWTERVDYNLDRMLVHGLRRAAEMEEVVTMLDALGTGSAMSRGTVERQRALGSLGGASPQGLDAKLAALTALKQEKAA